MDEEQDRIIDDFDNFHRDYDKEETLAVLSERGDQTGEEVSRKKAHEDGVLHGASHTYIYRINNEGRIEILLQRRSPNKDSYPNCLDISSAGHMEPGMSFEETAVKELQEELGLEIQPEELKYAFIQRFSKVSEFRGKKFNDQEISKVYLLDRDIDPDTVTLQKEEVSEVVWKDSEEILRKIKEGDSEYCLELEEFERMLSRLKEIEEDKIMEEDLAKKLYEDTLLNSRYTNSPVIRDLAGKLDDYGEMRQIGAMIKSQSAAQITGYLENGDEEVARGISLGVELGKPNFGKIGEEFLMEKIPDYRRSELGLALTKVMLGGMESSRIDSIYEGVEAVLERKKEMSEEAKAAKVASQVYDDANKYVDHDEYRGTYTAALSGIYRGTRKYQKICTTNPKLLEEMRNKTSEKDVVRRNPIRRKELDTCFEYYMSHSNEIPEKFKEALTGYDERKIVAFYVASMKEANLHQLYVSQEKEEEKE